MFPLVAILIYLGLHGFAEIQLFRDIFNIFNEITWKAL